ncbi:MAG: hypothetical protein H7227_04215 [Actinobacteria bacterium]|nr:hypothetical protein [Actinomycetota bacterium]
MAGKLRQHISFGLVLALAILSPSEASASSNDLLKSAQDSVRILETKQGDVDKLQESLNQARQNGSATSAVLKLKSSLGKAVGEKADALTKASQSVNLLYKANRNLGSGVRSYSSLMPNYSAAQKKVDDFEKVLENAYNSLQSLKPNTLRLRYLGAKTELADAQDFYDSQEALYELDPSDLDSKELLDEFAKDLLIAQKALDTASFALLGSMPGMEVSAADQAKIAGLRDSIFAQQKILVDLNAELESDSENAELIAKTSRAEDLLASQEETFAELESNLLPEIADEESDQSIIDAQSLVKKAETKLNDASSVFKKSKNALLSKENSVKSNSNLLVILKAIRLGVKISL